MLRGGCPYVKQGSWLMNVAIKRGRIKYKHGRPSTVLHHHGGQGIGTIGRRITVYGGVLEIVFLWELKKMAKKVIF